MCACGASYSKFKHKCDIPSCARDLPKISASTTHLPTSDFLKNEAEAEKKGNHNACGPQVTMYSFLPSEKKIVQKTASLNSLNQIPNVESRNLPDLHATPYLFLDPLDVNPGCEDGVRLILNQFIEEGGPNQKIIPVVFDGGPLRMAHKLLCLEPHVFGRILLIPGAGHEELTMYRAFFQLIWHVLGEEFAISHGYTTERQQLYLQNVGDTHKGAEAHAILLEGLWHEVLYLYLVETRFTGDKNGFFDFLKETIYDDILYFGTLILLFRKGVRKNNFEMTHSAQTAFLPMWFTCAHPIYRMVIPAFLSDFLVMPENLKVAVRYWFHGTVTGTPDKCEGLDFVGESYNRYVLSTIPPRPTFNDWRIGIQSEGFVQTCREITKELVGKVPFHNCTATPHTPDVLSWHETLHGKLDLSKKNLKGDDIPNPTVFLTASTLMRDHLSKQFKTFTPFSKSSLR